MVACGFGLWYNNENITFFERFQQEYGNFAMRKQAFLLWDFIQNRRGDKEAADGFPPTPEGIAGNQFVSAWRKYELYHWARMAFLPGITDFEEVVKLDMQYISQ